MQWLAHAGEQHTSTNDSAAHLLSGGFVKYVVVTAIFVSIILLLAYASQPKQTKKMTKESPDE